MFGGVYFLGIRTLGTDGTGMEGMSLSLGLCDGRGGGGGRFDMSIAAPAVAVRLASRGDMVVTSGDMFVTVWRFEGTSGALRNRCIK
jgi:hypothetical protein